MSQCTTWYSFMNIPLLDADGVLVASHSGHHQPELAAEVPAGIGIIPGAS